jgi:hypothetical protein
MANAVAVNALLTENARWSSSGPQVRVFLVDDLAAVQHDAAVHGAVRDERVERGLLLVVDDQPPDLRSRLRLKLQHRAATANERCGEDLRDMGIDPM